MSSSEAEFFAAMMAAKDGVHIRDVLSDLGLLASGPTVIRTDNKSIIELSRDAVAFKKTKHILRRGDVSSRFMPPFDLHPALDLWGN